jgi:predicted Zn finger-like uncharacterized protein
MKFNCPQCNKPYLIADERVRGKILKIRCKSCSTVITVREGMEQGAPAGRRARPPSATAAAGQARPVSESAAIDAVEVSTRDLGRSETAHRLSSALLDGDDDAPPPPDDEWYLSVDGVQDGPFSVERAREWIANRGTDDEIYCWRDTFDDWLPIDDVPELQGARRVSKLALRAPPMGRTPAFDSMKSPERVAGGPDLDMFGEDDGMTTIDPRPFAGMAERGLAPAAAAAAEADDEPVVRVIIAGAEPVDPVALTAPAPIQAMPSERPVLGRPLSMPGIAAASAGAGNEPSQAAPRAWLSDPLSGPSPALRLPAPYPTVGDAQPVGAASAAVRGGRRTGLVVVLLLAVIGSGLGAYLLVRNFVQSDDAGAARRGDAADSALPPLHPEDVSAALQRPENQAALKQCYDRARQDSPDLQIGRLDLDLSVSPTGQVARVSLSRLGDTRFGTCLIENIQTWTFPASSTGVTARIPLIFGP